MSTLTLEKLAPLVDRRFQSFAEATDAALDSLAASLPGCIVLTQTELEGGVCRVFDFRGPNFVGTERAMVMPTDGERVDAAFLDSLGVKDVISVPVELNAGIVGGVLLAISPEENSYTREHSTVIAIAARVLGYEWERVRTRAELRTLLQQVRDGDQYDPETGLRNRVGFEELLHREWRLARRGTLPSTVVAIRIEMSSDETDGAATLKHLAAKDAAEVLAGAARGTDHVGRIGEWSFGVVMIGCDDEAGVMPLIQRYEDALSRATDSRAFQLSVSSGSQRLVEASSAQIALESAEAEANEQIVTPTLAGSNLPEPG